VRAAATVSGVERLPGEGDDGVDARGDERRRSGARPQRVLVRRGHDDRLGVPI